MPSVELLPVEVEATDALLASPVVATVIASSTIAFTQTFLSLRPRRTSSVSHASLFSGSMSITEAGGMIDAQFITDASA